MKKTLLITMEFAPTIGGIGIYCESLAKALPPESLVVLAPRGKKGETKEWDEKQLYKIIRKHFLFPRPLWPRWMRLFLEVWRIVHKEKIQLILIHHALPVGYVGVLIHRLLKVPFLLFSHGTDLVAGTNTAWKQRMLRFVSKESVQIIFNSQSLKHRFLQVLPEFEEKATVVYPCPDPDFLNPPSKEENKALRQRLALEGKIILLSVGRITDGKGFTHLARLLPKLVEKVPHLAWLVVGDGPKKEATFQAVLDSGLQSIVRMVGEVQPEELKQYYYAADLFCVLTHPDEGKEEGLGLVFLEASAAGLPIVAGKSGGVEEAVIHTSTGLVVDLYKGDEAIIDAIATLAHDKAFAERLGTAAKERIEADFVWEHQVEKLKSWIM